MLQDARSMSPAPETIGSEDSTQEAESGSCDTEPEDSRPKDGPGRMELPPPS